MPKFKLERNESIVDIEYTDTDNVMIALCDTLDWGTCGGSCACGTCLCQIIEGEEYFESPSEEEKRMINAFGQAEQRLGCQLSLENVPDNKLVIKVEK